MDEFKENVLTESELTDVNGGAYVGPCIQYIVVKGDNLSKIAARYNTTVQILVDLNHIKNRNLIRIGQVLLIPALIK
ncbi:MAG: LysM domain-containing protein [Clostridia bacterium]